MAINTRTRPTPQPEPPATGPPAPDLTVNKVLAGAGAAATSAILGSYFGVAGTVAGAAIGSVASTVAASLYQRSLDRTRAAVAARVRIGGRVAPGEITVPIPRLPADVETVRLRAEPVVRPRRPRRRLAVIAGATVLVFLLGMLTVTGIEWIKGSPLNAEQPGTSVGRVIHGGQPATHVPDVTSDEPDGADERSADPTESERPPTTLPTVPPTSENPVPPTNTPPPSSEQGDGGLLPTLPRPTDDAPSPN